MMTVLSLGAGVQSTAVLLEAAEYTLSIITEDKWLSYEDEAAGREGAINKLENAIDIANE